MVVVVRWTGKVGTVSFNMKKLHTISISRATRERFLVFIHTLKHSTMTSMPLSHDVAVVLPGPGWGQLALAGIMTTLDLVDTQHTAHGVS